MRKGLASVAWLAERLGQPNLRVVDATWFLPSSPFASPVAARAAHAAARVPGSTFWDLDEVSDAAAAPSTPHNLPTPAQFAAEARRHGIAPDTRVVCYDQLGVFSAPRLWHTLRAFGVEAAVLDGGLPAWAAAGHAVERGEPAVEPAAAPAADFAYSGELQWRLGDVEAWLASDRTVQLVDARPAGRFRGTAPEPRAGCRPGHAPGARSVPFLDLLDPAPRPAPGPGGPFRGATLKPVGGLRAAFAAAGVAVDAPAAATCGSGLTAAVVALALHRCGAAAVPIYDGAWCEYEASGLPVVVDAE